MKQNQKEMKKMACSPVNWISGAYERTKNREPLSFLKFFLSRSIRVSVRGCIAFNQPQWHSNARLNSTSSALCCHSSFFRDWYIGNYSFRWRYRELGYFGTESRCVSHFTLMFQHLLPAVLTTTNTQAIDDMGILYYNRRMRNMWQHSSTLFFFQHL